jgi:hypothetical protein
MGMLSNMGIVGIVLKVYFCIWLVAHFISTGITLGKMQVYRQQNKLNLEEENILLGLKVMGFIAVLPWLYVLYKIW